MSTLDKVDDGDNRNKWSNKRKGARKVTISGHKEHDEWEANDETVTKSREYEKAVPPYKQNETRIARTEPESEQHDGKRTNKQKRWGETRGKDAKEGE